MVWVVQEYKSSKNRGKEELKLEVSSQIKKYRSNMGISQEELAEKIYVSRQTVSNWETGKNYPDIHSLLLLSSLFNVSLDQLIKGDVVIMKKEIKEMEIKKFDKYGRIFTVLLFLTVITAVPLAAWLKWYALIPWGMLFTITMYFALKLEKIKKDNDISTYKEIVAFTEGKLLDDMETQQEIGKRPYQKVLLVLGSAVFGFIVCYLMGKIFLP